jgi:hypothetical protein
MFWLNREELLEVVEEETKELAEEKRILENS